MKRTYLVTTAISWPADTSVLVADIQPSALSGYDSNVPTNRVASLLVSDIQFQRNMDRILLPVEGKWKQLLKVVKTTDTGQLRRYSNAHAINSDMKS